MLLGVSQLGVATISYCLRSILTTLRLHSAILVSRLVLNGTTMVMIAISMMMGSPLPAPQIDGSETSEKYTDTEKGDLFDGTGGNKLIIAHEGDNSLLGGDGAD